MKRWKLRLVTLIFAVMMAIGGLASTAQPTMAMKQIIIGGYADALSKTAEEDNSLQGGSTWVTTAILGRYQIIPTSGTFSRLSVELSGVPGTNPYIITLYVNGASTSLGVTIAADGTTAIDTDAVDVVAGDYVFLRSSFTSAPDNTPTARWSIQFEGDTANESIILGRGAASTTANQYTPIMDGTSTSSNTESTTYQIIPTGGTISKLYIKLSADPGNSPDAYTTKLRVNAADSDDGSGNPLSCTIVADNTTGNDTTHTISVSAGDYVNMAIIPVDTPTASLSMGWGMVFTATIDGESLILGQSSDVPTNSQTEYNSLSTNGMTNAWSTTENYQGGQAPTEGMVLKKFYVMLSGAPGTGNTWTFTVRATSDVDGSTPLVVAITGASDTTGNTTTETFTVGSYDDLSIMAVPDSAPTVRTVYWGLVCYMAGATFDITNTPSTKAFGVVATNTTYYAFGSAPSNPVQDAECTFTLTSTGSAATDIDIHGHNATGGVGWTLGASAGADQFKVTAYYSGQNPASGVVLTTADQEFYDNLAASGHIHWDFQIITPTSNSDGTEKTFIITITGRAHS